MPSGLDWAVQSGLRVGAVLNGALLNIEAAVNGESLVHMDIRDIVGICRGHVTGRGDGSNCSCGRSKDCENKEGVADHNVVSSRVFRS